LAAIVLSAWAYFSYGSMYQTGTSWFGSNFVKVEDVVTTPVVEPDKADKKFLLYRDKPYTPAAALNYKLANLWGDKAYDHNWNKTQYLLLSNILVSLIVSRLVWAPFRVQYYKNNDRNFDRNGCNPYNTNEEGRDCVYQGPVDPNYYDL